MSKKFWTNCVFVLMAVGVLSLVGLAQEKAMSCNDGWKNSDRVSHCMMKEQLIAATGGTIAVDGKKNGGVSIKGWERREILVRAQIQSWASNKSEAEAIANQVRVEAAGANIYADGPAAEGEQG